MTACNGKQPRPLLLMVAGVKGAVGSTIAAAAAALQTDPSAVLPGLTTGDKFSFLGPVKDIRVVGWDIREGSLAEAVRDHGVLPADLRESYGRHLSRVSVMKAPSRRTAFRDQVARLTADMEAFRQAVPHALPVLVNLLPACEDARTDDCRDMDELTTRLAGVDFPDMAYALAAVRSGVPVVNFTPNRVETPLICEAAAARGVPMAGRDGKTGQTYFKVVLASALKARGLYVDGWYSLNILGNADGKNLMDPCRAAGKLANKTRLLDEVLGYTVGEGYGESAHKVHIDYYPPRGDAKEAWDVVDFRGLFGLPMSIRMDLQGRDSILAAPMAMDLARWVTVLHLSGFSGPVPALGFFFKKPVGDNPPLTFHRQIAALENLERICEAKMAALTRRPL